MPDMRTGRAFGQFPFIAKKKIEIAIIPFCWMRCPRTFDTAGDGIASLARSMAADPAKTHFFNGGAFRLGTNKTGITRSMRLAKSMATGNKGNGFFVIHCHPAKSFTNISCAGKRIWIAVWAFRIDIDQTHLHGGKRVGQFAVA